MIVNEETWRKSWGNLNWKKVTPSQIDELIEKGYDVNMIWRANYPLGYEHSNPLIESMKANNPVAFSHLIQRGADLNFRFPYANLYPEGARYSNHSIVTEAPSLIYIKYAQQKGLNIRAEDFLDVIRHKGKSTEEKLSFLADIFEKRKDSDESLKVLGYLSLIVDENFSETHFHKLLENVDFKSSHSRAIETLSQNRVLRKHVLKVLENPKAAPGQATRNQTLLRRLAKAHEKN